MRCILIGVGGFGNVWVNTLKAAGAHVVGLVDRDPNALAKAQAVLNVPTSGCFSELALALAGTKAEALICVTPPALHREHVVAGLRAGLHVISEKPMAESREDCQAMVLAAREAKRVYAVSQNYRYGTGMAALHRAVASGLIGKVGQVRIDFYKGHDFHGGFRHEMEFPVLVDMSIHHFDLLRYFTEANALRVSATAWNPPWSNYRGDASCSVLFEMERGVRAVYNASWCSQGSFSDWNGNWLLEGTRGSLTYEQGVIHHHEVDPHYAVRRVQGLPLIEPELTPQMRIFTDFTRAVAEGRQPETNCFDNINSVNMVFASVEAARTGRKISLTECV
ncbi:MAG: Gfo/Idh/MocA family oxidoreductase [Polyangiaceae bacterium]|nr:Gfo/Idh/MocA family oxidoreductase [Polyangiaceae bacterium]